MNLTTKLKRMGYTKQANGNFTKRVEFDIPNKPNAILVKMLTRDASGQLIRGERGQWVTKKNPVDTVKTV